MTGASIQVARVRTGSVRTEHYQAEDRFSRQLPHNMLDTIGRALHHLLAEKVEEPVE